MGGIVTFMKKGTVGMREMGKLGGRPRNQTLEELMGKTGTCTKEKKIERRALPGVKAELKLSSMVQALVGMQQHGELAGYQTAGSPEGASK
jgi:hypothetical protein